ncbi:hypothetical protein J2S74_001101 [Evansella vedderi]|uniref:Small, acid-soluble spore protein, alpha/beta type n=1 Tax=Evansella vedderi TaxID=38282 RepID=A0ABT9ZRA8_9BACI|nr:hypothetical protein [Evansella vedderi]MDQ0253729.1 hypothetical protein [Evansella vedderi]
MAKRNRLVVEGTDEFMNSFNEEIAQEFGIYHTTTQAEHKANISHAAKKIIDKKCKDTK